MADDEKDERIEDLPTLRSQRRFLEAMSLVCSAYYWFDVRINPESSLVGQSVHIGSVRYVLTALAIGLLWSAWRYAQQLYRAWREVAGDLGEDFSLERTRIANKIVRRYLTRLPRAAERRFDKPRFLGTVRVHRFNLEKAKRFDAKGKESLKLPEGPLGERSHSTIDTRFFPHGGGAEQGVSLGIGRPQTAWLSVRSALATAMRRPALFDYATPVLLFLFASLSLLLAAFHASPEPTVNSYWWRG